MESVRTEYAKYADGESSEVGVRSSEADKMMPPSTAENDERYLSAVKFGNSEADTGVKKMKAPSVDNYSEYDKPITAEDVKVLREIIKAHGDNQRVSINDFTSDDIQRAQKWAYEDRILGYKSPFFRAWFGECRMYEQKPVKLSTIPTYIGTNESRKANRGKYINADTKWEINASREGETNTISHSGLNKKSEYGLSGIRSLIENAILFDSEIHEHHSNNAENDMIAFDHKLYSIGINTDGEIGLYRLTVEEYFQDKTHTNNKRFHNLKYIEKVAEVSADALANIIRSGGSTNDNSTTKYSVSDLYSFVKEYDREFHAGMYVLK